MRNQIVSEIRKLRTTRSGWGLLVGSSGLVGLGVVGVLWESTTARLAAPLAAQSVTHVALSVSWVFVLILGLRSFTDEFRNGSIVPTLLADPHRRQVLWAKLIAMAVAAIAFSVAAASLTVAIAVPWIVVKGIALDVAFGPLTVWFGKLLLISLLFAAIGVGVGLAVRHQVAAIVGSIVLVTIVEDLLSGLAPKLAPYFPTAGVWSIAGFGGAIMSPVGGALVLGAWAVGAVGLGAALMERRDIA